MAARYFLVSVLCIPSYLVAGQSSNYALEGGTVFLRPDIAGQPDGILWKYNGNKVVEFNGKEQDVYSPFTNRITLDWVTAELIIADLRFEDSGDYELEVDVNKRLHRSLHKLEIIDKVAKPTISCEMNDGGGSNTSGKLVCSAEARQHQSLMQFEWRAHGDVQLGPQIHISLRGKHDEEVYSCSVSNRLSSEEATFTAKDCYPDENSLIIPIVISVTAIVCVLVGLAILLFCKLRHKACFAKHDVENQSPPGRTEGLDEKRPLVQRASTRPSTQPLCHFYQEHENNEVDEMPRKGHVRRLAQSWSKDERTAFSPRSVLPSSLYVNNLASNDKGDADAGQQRESPEEKVPQRDASDSEKDNEPDPAGASDDFSEDTQSNPKSPFSPEHPEPETEADEDEEAQSAPADAETYSAARPHSPLTGSSLNMAPKDTTGEHEEVTNSDQVTGESAEKHVSESDSSGKGDGKESDESSEDKQLSTASEQRGSKTLLHEKDLNLSQEETNASKDNKQETVKPVSDDKDKDKTDSGDDHEETDQDLYSATSQQPQSATPTKPDKRNADTCQESPDSAQTPPDEEEALKTCSDSDETEGQSDKGEGETVEDKDEVQCGLKGEEPGDESCSGDEAGQEEDEVVA